MNSLKNDKDGKASSRRKLLLNMTAIFSGFTFLPRGSFSLAGGVVNSPADQGVLDNMNNQVGWLNEDFLLSSRAAKILYHDYAKSLPIIDYHCHLSPAEIASNKTFNNLTQLWLEGDHYKMRAMRANGISEKYITGTASDFEKFTKWAETVPYTIMNPLYHWTHLELKRYFGIDKALDLSSAKEIYDKTTTLLQTADYKAQDLIKRMHVEVVCTTDDPVDDLLYHQNIRQQEYSVKVLPAWRPDKVMAAENPEEYNRYLDKLSAASGTPISKYDDLLHALNKRQEYFSSMGCKLSDHGSATFYAEDYTESEIKNIFIKVRSGNHLSEGELLKYKSALLIQFAEMNHSLGWTQQFHVGVIRNNNTKMLKLLGPDKGYDSIGDFDIAVPMSKVFDRLSQKEKLAKTIVYNLNPRDNEVIITMLGNFNDGTMPGKMQYGSAWWFLDQKDGMEAQMKALSNMGLLARFIGMTTDSRSFLSYTRHEYFRRILCNLIGTNMENGELPADMNWLGKVVQGICYDNAKEYFRFG